MRSIDVGSADDSTFCPELWQRIFLMQVNDRYVGKPCCYATPNAQNQVMFSDPTKIFDHYNQLSTVEKLRNDNLAGRLDAGCEVCLHAERATGSSGRTRAIEQLAGRRDLDLTSHVDLNLGNLCNLACAICDPHSSTSWVPVYQKMTGKTWYGTRYKTNDRPVIDDPEWFKNIKTLQLQGGEVFLQTAYTDFFRNLSRHRDLGEISVVIFTNATARPQPELFELLGQCLAVDLYFSIDDIAERFEYQRHGASWSKVLDNIRWFQSRCGPNYTLGFHPTYSLLNIFYLAELHDFFRREFPAFRRNFGPYHIGTGPLIADSLPAHIRSAVLAKHQGIDELSWLADYIREESRELGTVRDYILRYDQATNGSYEATHPEFWSLLKG